MKRLWWLVLVFAFSIAMFAQGPGPGSPEQAPPPPGQGPGMMHGGMGMGHGEAMGHGEGMGHDPMGESMFPPDFILEHAQDINLTTEQKTAIRNEVKATQPKFTDLQFQLQ